jgi:hypothetical protein
MTTDTKHSTDTATTDDEAQELLELIGMGGLFKLRLDAFKARMTGDLHVRELVERAALVYGRGDPSAAAFWLPTLQDQAHWLGLFSNPLASPAASVTLSSSSALAH